MNKNNGTNDKEAGYLKNPAQVTVSVFDVQHWDAQQGYDEYTQEHGTVQQMHYPMKFGAERDVLRSYNTPNGLSKVLGATFVPTELL